MQDFVATYASVIWVTLGYVALYYVFMTHVAIVKIRVMRRCTENGERFERYTGHYPDLLAADRVQLNMLEHMPPFLVLLWLQAVVVSPRSASIMGAIYVIIRALYPVFLGGKIKSNIPVRLMVNTFAAYGVLAIMGGWIVSGLM